MDPLTQKTSLDFDEEVAQTFQDVNNLILHTLNEAKLPSGLDRTG